MHSWWGFCTCIFLMAVRYVSSVLWRYGQQYRVVVTPQQGSAHFSACQSRKFAGIFSFCEKKIVFEENFLT